MHLQADGGMQNTPQTTPNADITANVAGNRYPLATQSVDWANSQCEDK
jgi:hypothetical protein